MPWQLNHGRKQKRVAFGCCHNRALVLLECFEGFDAVTGGRGTSGHGGGLDGRVGEQAFPVAVGCADHTGPRE
jgi:hypothetical protein